MNAARKSLHHLIVRLHDIADVEGTGGSKLASLMISDVAVQLAIAFHAIESQNDYSLSPDVIGVVRRLRRNIGYTAEEKYNDLLSACEKLLATQNIVAH